MKPQTKIHRLGADRSHVGLGSAERVRVDEKIDGSQITFGVFDGRLVIRSKSQELNQLDPPKMFAEAVLEIGATARRLRPGWTYHGEYLQKPRHNVLAYERVPRNHVVIFDVFDDHGLAMQPGDLAAECDRLGAFEPVQHRFMFMSEVTAAAFERSQLGGEPEGVIVKHAGVSAKLVSEAFKEVKVDKTSRTRPNPTADAAVTLANRFCPAARYLKAIQRLKEAGEFTGTMTDIGPLRREISADLEAECAEEIKDYLYQSVRKDMLRASLNPLADWFRQYLTNDNAFWTMQREETP